MSIASPGRVATLAALAAAIALTSGCNWFRKDNESYKLSGEARPLELPPELNMPNTQGAMALPSTQSATASQQAAAAPMQNPSGFHVAGEREAIFAQVDAILAASPEVTVSSTSKLLGSHDVSVAGVNFLVRVTQVGDSVFVSAIDPRGELERREEAVRLIAQLKEALGGR